MREGEKPRSQQEFFAEYMELCDLQIKDELYDSVGFCVDDPNRNRTIRLVREMENAGLEVSKNETKKFTNYFFDCKHVVEIEGRAVELTRRLSICFFNGGWTELRWG